MKWAVRITIAVVLGAVINVGVAWGCALWSGLITTDRWTGINAFPQRVRSTIPEAWLMSPDPTEELRSLADGRELKGVGLRCEAISVQQMPISTNVFEVRFIRHAAAGWPMKTLSYTTRVGLAIDPLWESRSLPAPGWLHPIARAGMMGNPSAPNDLPLDPMGMGTVLNTAFYAALILLLWRGPALLRRTIHARAGRCLSCGYNRKGLASPSTPCPECGAAPTPAPVAEVRG